MQMWTHQSRRHTLTDLALIFLSPLLLLLLNQDWFFTEIGLTDAWSYVGHFLLYGEDPLYNSTYKTVRFPYIFSAAAAYQILDAATATNLLGLGFLYIAAFSLYACLRFLFDKRTAFVTAFLFLTYMEFQGSYGWAYHNNAATAFFMLMLALLMRAAVRGPSPGILIGVGATWAACIITNLTFLPVSLLAFAAAYFFRTQSCAKTINKWEILKEVSLIILGLLIVSSVTSYIHHIYTGDSFESHAHGTFPIITRQLHVAVYSLIFQISQASVIYPFLAGVKMSAFLAMPFVFSVVAFWWLWCARPWAGSGATLRGEDGAAPLTVRHGLVLGVFFLVLFAAHLMGYAMGAALLWPKSQMVDVSAVMFLVIGAFIARYGRSMDALSATVLQAGTLAMILIPLVTAYYWGWHKGLLFYNIPFVYPAVLAVLGVGLYIHFRERPQAVFALLLCLGLANVLCANDRSPIGGQVAYYVNDQCSARRDLFLSVLDGNDFLTEVHKNYQMFYFYYDYHDRFVDKEDGCALSKLHSLFLFSTSLTGLRGSWNNTRMWIDDNYVEDPGWFKSLDDFVNRVPDDAYTVIIATPQGEDEKLARVMASAAMQGRELEVVKRKRFQRGEVEYSLIVLANRDNDFMPEQ